MKLLICSKNTNKHYIWSKLQAIQINTTSLSKRGQCWLCVGSKKTNLEIEFWDIKQSFAAGLKAFMLDSDPVVLECFSYDLLQHLWTQKTYMHTVVSFSTVVKTSTSVYSLNTLRQPGSEKLILARLRFWKEEMSKYLVLAQNRNPLHSQYEFSSTNILYFIGSVNR